LRPRLNKPRRLRRAEEQVAEPVVAVRRAVHPPERRVVAPEVLHRPVAVLQRQLRQRRRQARVT